jgi:hypothetical protein
VPESEWEMLESRGLANLAAIPLAIATVQIADFEPPESWQGSSLFNDTTFFTEGSYSLRFTTFGISGDDLFEAATRQLPESLDLRPGGDAGHVQIDMRYSFATAPPSGSDSYFFGVRFYTDDSNYYHWWTVGNHTGDPLDGVQVDNHWAKDEWRRFSIPKGSFTATGDPNWGDINKVGLWVMILVPGNPSTSGSVYWDNLIYSYGWHKSRGALGSSAADKRADPKPFTPLDAAGGSYDTEDTAASGWGPLPKASK